MKVEITKLERDTAEKHQRQINRLKHVEIPKKAEEILPVEYLETIDTKEKVNSKEFKDKIVELMELIQEEVRPLADRHVRELIKNAKKLSKKTSEEEENYVNEVIVFIILAMEKAVESATKVYEVLLARTIKRLEKEAVERLGRDLTPTEKKKIRILAIDKLSKVKKGIIAGANLSKLKNIIETEAEGIYSLLIGLGILGLLGRVKVWITMGDSRVREEHVKMNGEQVSVSDKFSNGFRFPKDPIMRRVSPAQWYGCRCRISVR